MQLKTTPLPHHSARREDSGAENGIISGNEKYGNSHTPRRGLGYAIRENVHALQCVFQEMTCKYDPWGHHGSSYP